MRSDAGRARSRRPRGRCGRRIRSGGWKCAWTASRPDRHRARRPLPVPHHERVAALRPRSSGRGRRARCRTATCGRSPRPGRRGPGRGSGRAAGSIESGRSPIRSSMRRPPVAARARAPRSVGPSVAMADTVAAVRSSTPVPSMPAPRSSTTRSWWPRQVSVEQRPAGSSRRRVDRRARRGTGPRARPARRCASSMPSLPKATVVPSPSISCRTGLRLARGRPSAIATWSWGRSNRARSRSTSEVSSSPTPTVALERVAARAAPLRTRRADDRSGDAARAGGATCAAASPPTPTGGRPARGSGATRLAGGPPSAVPTGAPVRVRAEQREHLLEGGVVDAQARRRPRSRSCRAASVGSGRCAASASRMPSAATMKTRCSCTGIMS